MSAATPLTRILETGERIAGRYAITKLLASGSMGAVYAATDAELGRRVAIKIAHGPLRLQRELDRRLRTEARAAGRLEGEHVARVFEYGHLHNGSPYLVLEHLRGQTLEAERNHGRLEPRAAVRWILQACLGLAEPHALGIAHRDIKPLNLFVAERLDGERRLKIIDFGAAAFVERTWQSGSRDRAAIGTLHYMAPEQLQERPVIDTRSDVWALGATLYELLSGASPFEAKTKGEMLERITEDEPRSLLASCPGLSPALAMVVERCLTKSLGDRMPDVVALASALAPHGPDGSRGLAERTAKVASNVAAEASPIVVPPRPRRERMESRPLLLETNPGEELSERAPVPRPRVKLRSVPFELG